MKKVLLTVFLLSAFNVALADQSKSLKDCTDGYEGPRGDSYKAKVVEKERELKEKEAEQSGQTIIGQ